MRLCRSGQKIIKHIKVRSQNCENRCDLSSISSTVMLHTSFTTMQMQFKTVLENIILFVATTLSDNAIFICKKQTVKRTIRYKYSRKNYL